MISLTAVWKCLTSPYSAVDNSYQHGSHSLIYIFLNLKKTSTFLLVPKLKIHPLCIKTYSNMINGPECGGEKNGEPFPLH